MGIKGSSTVVLNFDKAKGYLIGERNKGLEYRFTYMSSLGGDPIAQVTLK